MSNQNNSTLPVQDLTVQDLTPRDLNIPNQIAVDNDLQLYASEKNRVIINNTEKKIKFIGIGAGGANILNHIKPVLEANRFLTSEMEFFHIDTSTVSKVNGVETTVIGDGNGSGGQLVTNVENAKRDVHKLQSIFNEKNTLYVLITGTSGGSGIILPVITPYTRGFPTLLITSDSFIPNNGGRNTLKIYKALLNQSRNGSFFIYSVDNGAPHQETNKKISTFLTAVALFYAEEVKDIDLNDINYLFTDKQLPNNAKNMLYAVNASANRVERDLTMNSKELVLDDNVDGQFAPIEGNSSKMGYIQDVDLFGSVHKLILSVQRNKFDKSVQALANAIEQKEAAEHVNLSQLSFDGDHDIIV